MQRILTTALCLALAVAAGCTMPAGKRAEVAGRIQATANVVAATASQERVAETAGIVANMAAIRIAPYQAAAAQAEQEQ